MKPQSVSYSYTNTSDKFLLVGNYHDMIAAYDSTEEARADLDNQVPSIEESKWGVVQIVSPGETVEGKLCSYRPLTKAEQAEQDAQMSAAFPWMIND